MLNSSARVAALLALVTLAACGGGGGGVTEPGPAAPGPAGTTTPVVPVAPQNDGFLSFTPNVIALSLSEGDRPTVRIDVKAAHTESRTLNVQISDTGAALQSATINTINAVSYLAALNFSQRLPVGQTNGNIVVKLCLDSPTVCKEPYPGSPWLIPYALTVTAWAAPRTVHKLLVSETGVALASLPDRARLSRTLKVSDNLGAATGWTASSDQSWLKVTATGRTGDAAGALTLSADPASLPSDAISYATVSVKASDGSIVGDSVTVGLWKGRASVPAEGVATAGDLGRYYQHYAADPVRPYIYAHKGDDTIDVYNVHTAAKVSSVTVAGSTLAKMVPSPDGKSLFVVDPVAGVMKVFDLQAGIRLQESRTVGRILETQRHYLATDFVYARPNGVGILVTNNGFAYRASDGKLLREHFGGLRSSIGSTDEIFGSPYEREYVNSHLGVTGDGTKIFYSGSTFGSYGYPGFVRLDYSESNGGMLSVQDPVTGVSRVTVSAPIYVSLDGDRVYMPEADHCSIWNSADLSRVGMPGFPGCKFLMTDGRLVAATEGAVLVYKPDGRTDQSIAVGYPSQVPNLDVVSSDALSSALSQTGPYPYPLQLLFLPIRP